MINQLPRWVEIGGFCLALIAGSVNAIALLGFNHQGSRTCPAAPACLAWSWPRATPARPCTCC